MFVCPFAGSEPEKSVLQNAIFTCISKGYILQMETVIRASRKGYHIEEVVVNSL